MLQIVGVHSAKFDAEKVTENVGQAVMRHGIEHPVVNDADFRIWNEYTVRAWPTVVLIDPLGKVIDQVSGEIHFDEWAQRLRRLIAEYEEEHDLGELRSDLSIQSGAPQERPLAFPSRVLATEDGRLFVSDTGHHRILEIGLAEDGRSGRLVRVFGSGRPAFVDGSPSEACFHDPHGMALSGQLLYAADTENHAIRAIDLVDGHVSTVAGTGRKGRGFTAGGPARETDLRSPWAIIAEEDLLLIAMAGSHQIWLLREGNVGVFAGTGAEELVDGPRERAGFNQPSDLAYGNVHLFVCDAEASAIRAIRLEDDIPVMTLVGQGLFVWGDVDGQSSEARLQHPTGIDYQNELLYIADSYNHKIKTLDPFNGTVETLIGSGERGSGDGSFGEAQLYEPEGVSVRDGMIYIADTNNHLIRVGDIESGKLSTLEIQNMGSLIPSRRSGQKETWLDDVEALPGLVEIALKLSVREGYKLNPNAPIQVSVAGEGSYTFTDGDSVLIETNLEESRDLAFELVVYYCDAEDERLCYIEQKNLVLPLRAAPDAASRIDVEVGVGRPHA